MKTIFTAVFLVSFSICFAQKPDADKLLEEGKMLYYLEKASWYATDHFLEAFKSKIDQIRGYLSYYGNNGKVYSIFYSQSQTGEIELLARYMFDADPKPDFISLDTLSLKPLPIEYELFTLRNSTLKLMYENDDDFFLFYENTSNNIIPIIDKKERKVYILTASEQYGNVFIGNDYLLTFTPKGNLKDKRKLHNTLIEIPYKNPGKEKITTTMHTHILSNHIEPTDICTLLLYRDYVEWDEHFVIHKDYISIFDLKDEMLTIMKKKDFEKIVNSIK